MINHRQYKFKKIYLNDKIFKNNEKELKIAYFNINGLFEGNHADYLNADRNLMNVDLIVLAETKLTSNVKTKEIENQLKNWALIKRFDSNSGKRNMGLLLLTPRKNMFKKVEGVSHHTSKRDGSVQIQGVIVRLKCGLSLGFIYCRSSPTNEEIEHIKKVYSGCISLMGDFNLSHRISSQSAKLRTICGKSKISILHEITRAMSYNQLDYVMIEKPFEDFVFDTSYYNFISDNKSTVLRIGLEGNMLKDEIIQQFNFDEELHLKAKSSRLMVSFNEDTSESNMSVCSDT